MKKRISTAVLLTLTLLSTTAYGANTVVVIPLGKTVNIEAPIKWQAEWQEGAAYILGDGLQYAGASYICTDPHTASIANSPPNNSFWSLMASQGSKGDKGDTGAIGAQGTQGLKGDQGIQGITGNTGDTGPQGIQGNQGNQGETGNTGLQGPIGTPGPQGDTGLQGPVGTIGPQGTQGIQGDTGPQGAAGSSGVQVYDANNQNLGMLLTFNEFYNYFTVFNSAINLVVKISKVTGALSNDGEIMGYHINTANCSGKPLYAAYITTPTVEKPGPVAGVLVANPTGDATSPYISYEYPPITVTSNNWSRMYIDGGSSCVANQVLPNLLYPIKYYTQAEVPITFPIAFPLHFDTP